MKASANRRKTQVGARPARIALALFLVVTATLLGGGRLHPALATPEGAITYAVYQSPPRGSVLQVGTTLTFRIGITSAPGAFTGPVVYDMKKPANMTFASFGMQSGNILTSCADNTPMGGYLRCTVGGGASIPAGALDTGTLSEIVLNFTVDAASAVTLYDDNAIQSLFSDTNAGFRNAADAADNTQAGDALDASVGFVTVTNILGANASIVASTNASPASIFEGGLSFVTVTFTHGLGGFGATLQPIDVAVTNADIQAGSVSCPGGTGIAGIIASSTVRCTGSTVGTGSAISFNLRARDTASGGAIIVTLSAPSLGLTSGEAAISPIGTATQVIGVNEVGLDTVNLPAPGGAAPPWSVGAPIAVCTATTPSDLPDDRATGAAQSPALVTGTSTLSPVVPLGPGDFTLSGPGGAVGFTYLDGSPANCGANQSGLQFTPSVSGTYIVTAFYNGDTTSAPTLAATRGSNVLAINVQSINPAPTLNSLTPASAGAGGPSFTLTVNGSGFGPASVVRWNGLDRGTSYVSPAQLQATIFAADIAATGNAAVTVFNPAPGGGSSAGSAFTVTGAPNPAPLISGLTPASVGAGSPAFTMTVNGSNFVNGSVVRWNGADRATTFINGTQLTAGILLADLASAGTASVSVFNPAPGGGTSPTSLFTIGAAANPAPSITSLSPSSGLLGGAAFTLTVNGSNLAPASVVRWNGSDRATTFVSGSQLSASILVADLSSVGTAGVSVFTASPGGGTSTVLNFAINNPSPSVGSLAPNSATAGAAGLTLTVNGTGFTSTSTVQWNGSARATTYVSPAQLTATISAADIASAGTANVSVSTAAPGGGTSAAATFNINNPTPGVASLTPSSAIAGDPALTLTVNGTAFTNLSIVRWNGSDRATTYVSATQVTAAISAADLADGAAINVTVFTPAPGGSTSSPLVFTVSTPLPVIGAVTPPNAVAGGAAFALTVAGTGFTPSSKILWNGTQKTTSYVSSTQLSASIDPGDITTPGSTNVSVSNPAPGGGISANVLFPIVTAAPSATDQLVLSTPVAGSLVGRSRLSFTAAHGTLAAPGSLTFVIRRTSDNLYWNGVTGAWQAAPFENLGVADATAAVWTYSVIGAARRQFANTTVTVELHAVVGITPYTSAATAQVEIR